LTAFLKANEMVDDRSSTAKALSRVSQITTISLILIVPALMGYGLESLIGGRPAWTVIGMLVGMLASGWQLINLVAQLNAEDDAGDNDQSR